MHSYVGKLLFVDLSTGKTEVRPLEEKLARDFLGGYGLGAKILYDEMPAHTDPFAPESVIGFISGALNGTPAIMAGRYAVVSKSPITGGFNDANSGGSFGPMLRRSGFDAVFVRGVAPKPVYIMIDDGNVEICDASDLWGKTITETEKALKEKLGDKKFNAAIVGPAGENKLYLSAIMNDSHRAAGRGGSGAVMGSKNLKALVVSGNHTVTIADREEMVKINKNIMEWQKNGPAAPFIKGFSEIGTTIFYDNGVLVGDAFVKNGLGAGTVDLKPEDITPITGPEMDKRWKRKKFACAACPVGCGAHYKIDELGIEETGRPEYETQGSFCSQMLMSDPLVLNKCNTLCNEYGLDTISVGSTIAWAMECYEEGVLSKEELDGVELTWGNGEAILAIMEKIVKCEGVGKILGNGSMYAADYFGKGHERSLQAGRIELPQHDARYGPGLARTYKYDPTPGRHVKGGLGGTCGNQPPEVKFNYDALAEPDFQGVIHEEILNAGGFCEFTNFALAPDSHLALINAATGFNYTPEERAKLGQRIFAMRHAFNLREGFRRKDATISDRAIGKPPLKEGPLAGVTVDVERMADNFFRKMGYDVETAVPKKETLEYIGSLENVIADLYPEK